MKCRICEADCRQFLDLGRQPIANNFLTRRQFDKEFFYHLRVYFCPECFTVQIGNNCPTSDAIFNRNYSFFTGSSKAMTGHFAKLADIIKERYLPQNGLIMEIGSNDGTFLKHFKDNVHLGFDPSESVNDIARSKGIKVYPYPFESFGDAGDLIDRWPKTDVFVSANTFAHIPNRHAVLENIKKMLTPEGRWINEEPYLKDIISKLAYDQVYNEHIYYTSIVSMRNVLRMHDLDILDFEFIWTHGGSIRYVIGHRDKENESINDAITAEGLYNFNILKQFGRDVVKNAKAFKRRITELKMPVGYGASAKSTTILNYCQIGPDIISKIYDTTPEKQGKYSPGMHIPIVPYEDFQKDTTKDVVLFIWNHAEEVLRKETKRNWHMPNLQEKDLYAYK